MRVASSRRFPATFVTCLFFTTHPTTDVYSIYPFDLTKRRPTPDGEHRFRYKSTSQLFTAFFESKRFPLLRHSMGTTGLSRGSLETACFYDTMYSLCAPCIFSILRPHGMAARLRHEFLWVYFCVFVMVLLHGLGLAGWALHFAWDNGYHQRG